MQITITARHMALTDAIEDYVKSKINRFAKREEIAGTVDITLSVDKQEHVAHLTSRVRGREIHCCVSKDDLYAAIDALSDKFGRQIDSAKGRSGPRGAIAVKHMPIEQDLIEQG